MGKRVSWRFLTRKVILHFGFLRVAKSMGFGIQVGREYYIKQKEFEKILNTYQGLKLEI